MTTDPDVIVPEKEGWYWFEDWHGKEVVTVTKHGVKNGPFYCYFPADDVERPIHEMLKRGTFLHQEPLTPPGE